MSYIWNQILTAREASIKLGKNPKYIYFLWKRHSDILLKGSVKMTGRELLITREGYEYLKILVKKMSDLVINFTNSKVTMKQNNASKLEKDYLEFQVIFFTKIFK
ncbi:hypothetical protein [Bacillus cereus]|uniref:Uncharacterized protein n=1 Tax=Bacillus cereus TaxID=1396 RepID=A0A9X6Z6S8_BACCE|nr:hypothetical protein [Bacillus cereus]PFD16692.1 hypothetical protein CN263_26350 [Bacillus cereus]PFW60459.1 hypothetical protein COL27_31215 [Bacillus sp. AFS075960]